MSDDNTSHNGPPSQRLALFGSVIGLAALGALVARRWRKPRKSAQPETPGLPVEDEMPVPKEKRKGRPVTLARYVSAWLAACGLLALSAFGFRYSEGPIKLPHTGAWLALAGGLTLTIAMRLGRPDLPVLTPARFFRRSEPGVSLAFVTAGVVALALLAEINTGLLKISVLRGASPNVQMELFCAGVILVVWGMIGVSRRTQRAVSLAFLLDLTPRPPLQNGKGEKNRSQKRLKSPRYAVERGFRGEVRGHRRGLFLLALITLLAFAVRTWNLEYALHIFMDEMNFVDGITALRDGSPVMILRPIGFVVAFPWIFPYLQLRGVEIFGPTLTGIRLVSVFMGTLTIPALYLLARTLFDRRTALLAAFLLAVFPPHIHFSRLGMNNIADPLFGTLALAFLARGLKTGRRADYALSGGMLGLTQYFYEGGRLFYPALMGLWLVVILIGWRRRIHWRGLVALVVTALLIAMPYYYTQIGTSNSLTPRLERMGHSRDYIEGLLYFYHVGGGLRVYWENNLRPPLLHLIYSPDGVFSGETGFFYGGNAALILPYMLPMFLAGLFYLLGRRRVVSALPLLWVLLVILGNSLIGQADWSARFVVVFPALPLLMAVGVRAVLPMTLPVFAMTRRPVFWQRLVAGGVILGVIGLAFIQIPYYFGPHLEINNRQVRREGFDAHDMMFRSRDFPAGTQVILISEDAVWEPQIYGMIAFWKLDITVAFWPPDDQLPDHLAELDRQHDYAFFVKPTDNRTIRLLRDLFDDLEGPEWSPDRYNVPRDRQYWLYFAERHSGITFTAASYGP